MGSPVSAALRKAAVVRVMDQTQRPAGPRVIAWEITRRCGLRCRHCRAGARDEAYAGELSTAECRRVIESIGAFVKPVLILTGGEPMARDDVYDLASCGSAAGLRVVMAPCGPMLTPATVARLRDSGVQAISISIDGASAASHDRFRGVPGIYERTMAGLGHAIAGGMPFQINTTVTRLNVSELPAILARAVELGAQTFDLFFLVPTGRGRGLRDLELSAAQYEETLAWAEEASRTVPLRVKTTCAPQYARVLREAARSRGEDGPDPRRGIGGCMAGRGFVFISHRGILQPCGFLDLVSGDLRASGLDFRRAYEESEVFHALQDVNRYGGKCGGCEYRWVCGGCRARAFERTGDFLAEAPSCGYTPGR